MKITIFKPTLAGIVLLAISVAAQSGAPVAVIDSGKVSGISTTIQSPTAGVNKYLGIPYAKAERFSPPSRAETWSQTLDASAIKPACIQQFNAGPQQAFTKSIFNSPAPIESEDCLYLNVFTPSAPAPAGRAVMVWFYGGSLQFGSGGQPGYDGSYLAGHQDVVIVTFNYRTNLFGFPASAEVPIAERNLAFLDQRAALDWVQRNIASFGGDSTKVTLFGESAGAASIDALLTSYPRGSTPPFRGAIMQSGQIGLRKKAPPATGPTSWEILAKEAGCTEASTLPCLKKVPATKLKEIIEAKSLIFSPTIDNVTFVAKAYLKRHESKIASIPTMVGSNSQEGRVFQVGKTDLDAYLKETFPANLTEKVKAAYTIGTQGLTSNYDVISAIMTDLQFTCPAFLQAHGSYVAKYPNWRYYFDATYPNLQAFPNAGVYHASEIGMVFGTYGKGTSEVSSKPSTAEQVALSNFMQGAWAKFAKDPAGGPGWTAVGRAHSGLPLNGSEPMDVGVLKGTGVTVVSRKDIDKHCSMYVPLYG